MSSKKQAKDPRRMSGAGGKESQHNDWGHAQAGAEGSVQSGAGGNIGGVPGSQHNDWGRSPVDRGDRPRQGVMPGEEMGHLRRRKTDR